MGHKFKQDDLVTFENAAAGHEGVLSDAAGSAVIKPCTPAEVSFYGSALSSHPAFAAYMPTFMGTLELSQQPDATGITPTANSSAKTSIPVTAAGDTDTTVAVPLVVPEDVTKFPSSKADPAIPSVSVPSTNSAPGGSSSSTTAADYGPAHGKQLASSLCIVLSNAAATFKRPNVLDLKLGARLWDDAASAEKRARLDKVSEESTSSSLGFRIAGMKVWQGKGAVGFREGVDGEGYKVYGKMYGRNFNSDNVRDAFLEYLVSEGAGLDGSLTKVLANRLRKEVTGIREMLEREESRMVGASILVVVEGDGAVLKKVLEDERQQQQGHTKVASHDDVDDDDDDEEEEEKPKAHEVKMIDFAHARWTPGKGPDENALQGVRSIERILTELEGRA
ncbi:MAG: hypothetical protein M1837_001126 [Sclerophora amabilis]|nr:MAG: hypothetical protein M1837_001126 [Sclerophora amabilis]